MNLLFTICARAGSKGIRGKNTKTFCDRPLLDYTIAAYDLFIRRHAKEYDHIFLAVNTDSEMLLEQMEELHVEYLPIPRAEELAGDAAGKKDVIKDTLQKCEEKLQMTFDVVIDLDLTSPLRTVNDIVGTLNCLLAEPDADISFSVTDARRSPYFNMVERKEDGYYRTVVEAEYTSRQQAPVCYDMNASIYAYARSYLLSNNVFRRKAVIWKMQDTGVLDIDSEEDLELMQVIGKYLSENREGYKELFLWKAEER